MQKPRKFYRFIIILLIINVSFFTLWFALGGRNLFRNKLTEIAGKLIKAEIVIGDLHISDKQIYLKDISFAMLDDSVSVQAKTLRIRYSIYRLLFSGFKPKNVISTIEIDQPEIDLNIVSLRSKEKKISKKRDFELPDISPYFKKLRITNGYVHADVEIELKILQEGMLHIEESLSKIDITVINDKRTKVELIAKSAMGGRVELNGFLDQGRVDIAEAKLGAYVPLFVSHPDISNFRSEINGDARFSQVEDAYIYDGDFRIQNTSAILLDEYSISFPALHFVADERDASLKISRALIAGNSLDADLRVQNYMDEMSFRGSEGRLFVDLNTIIPDLSGYVQGELGASGSIDEPDIRLNLFSERAAYREWEIEKLSAVASFDGTNASIDNCEATWRQQLIDLNAMLNIKSKELYGALITRQMEGSQEEIRINGSVEVGGLLLTPIPLLNARLNDIDFKFRELDLKSVSGTARMIPTDESLLFEADVVAANGIEISATGDLLDMHIVADAKINQLDIADLYDIRALDMISPLISGEIKAIMIGTSTWFRAGIDTRIRESYPYTGFVNMLGTIDYKSLKGNVIALCEDGELNGHALPFSLHTDLAGDTLHLRSLKLANIMNLSGRLNYKELTDTDFDISIRNLNSSKLISYYPEIAPMIPDFDGLNLFAKYNRQSENEIDGWLNIRNVDLISIIPLNLDLYFDGDISKLNIVGSIKDRNTSLIALMGEGSLAPKLSLTADAFMDGLKVEDVLLELPAQGTLFGKLNFALEDALNSQNRQMSFGANIHAQEIKYDEYTVEKLIFKGAQEPRALVVDTLYVYSEQFAEAWAKGSLDYNALENTFYEGRRNLYLSADIHLFSFIKELTDYIRESSGSTTITANISTQDEQFIVHSGNIDITGGHVLLKDQVEPMRNIEIKSFFDDNRLVVQRAYFTMGNGSFYMDNIFDPEPTDHFMIAFLDLGYFRILVEEPGIQATIPEIAPTKSLTNISVKGQDSRYATVRGPFDDMQIDAYVMAENLDILFPPGADNLLNLVMSVRKTGKKPDSEPLILPFTMDVYLNIGENVRYATYPTSLYLEPGGFLHILYDGNRFIVKEANITSERGTIDFFGTVFEVDNIAINMIDQQDILSVAGKFYKRSPDGSIITLAVHSTPEYDKSFFDRLKIDLASDNPADQNISQVLSRLRYNQSMEELPEEQKQHLLQDEALGLIGGNLDSTVFSPFIFPVENWIRRTLKLDGFTISAGFIKNIFTEYSSNSSDSGKTADISDITSDITQFSSSILLNNLSVSMSKYVAYRTFADYKITLQEATDMQKKTKIIVSQDVTLRLVLPHKVRLGYTLNYSPKDTGLTHEVMLQKTWRFRGL